MAAVTAKHARPDRTDEETVRTRISGAYQLPRGRHAVHRRRVSAAQLREAIAILGLLLLAAGTVYVAMDQAISGDWSALGATSFTFAGLVGAMLYLLMRLLTGPASETTERH